MSNRTKIFKLKSACKIHKSIGNPLLGFVKLGNKLILSFSAEFHSLLATSITPSIIGAVPNPTSVSIGVP